MDHLDKAESMLRDAGLSLAAMECGGEWLHPERWEVEKDGALRTARLLPKLGAEVLVVSGGRLPKGGVPVEAYRRLAQRMNELGNDCREEGVRLCFHPKRGTLVAYRDQIGLLMEETDPDRVSLCLDTGELALSGSDPLEIVRSYGPRIGHVHLKDLDWVTQRIAPVGRGSLDLQEMLEALVSGGYRGVLTVEMEPSADPLEEARSSRLRLEEWPGPGRNE